MTLSKEPSGMTDPPPDAGSPGVDRRHLQFSIRDFFLAAVVVSLYMASIKIFNSFNLFLVLAVLAWLTVGGLLVRFRATSPLLLLVTAPVLVMLSWGGFVLVTGSTREIHLDIPARVTIAFAFSWGVVTAVFVAAAHGVVALTRAIARLLCPRSRKQGLTSDSSAPRCPPFRLLIVMVVMRLSVSAAVSPAAFAERRWVRSIAYAANFILDVPHLPYLTHYLYIRAPRTFDESLHFVVFTACCGAPLYAILGAIAGPFALYLKGRFWGREADSAGS